MSSRSYPRIIVTGASIAQQSFKKGGFGSFLAEQYSGKADVINRGMSGYNSRQLLYKLKHDFPLPGDGKIILFVIQVGSNDSAISGPQRVPLEEYKSNLSAIIAHIRSAHPSAEIILITPSTYDQAASEALQAAVGLNDFPKDRTDDSAKAYAEACSEVAEREGVPAVKSYDIHRKMIDGGIEGWKLLPDGLHHSARGYAPLNEKLLEIINTSFPSISPSALPEAFDFFLTYALGTPGGNNPDETKVMQKRFAGFGPEMRGKIEAYVKGLEAKGSAEA